jgi:pyridine nucleotide-disulfide oxidoreductase family protein
MTSGRRLLLVGAGHAHAQVLLEWSRAPVPGVELVLVSPQADAPYSGMVPGWLAGLYRYDEICIAFAPLCAAAGARFVADELAALDPDACRATLAGGEVIGYDGLSLNVGSTLNPPSLVDDTALLSLRPISHLHERWSRLLDDDLAQRSDVPFTVTTAGAGAAGFEATLAVLARLRARHPQRRFAGRIVARSERLLDGAAPAAVRAAEQALAQAGVTLALGRDFDDGDARASDLVLWATGAQAHAWQRDAARRGTLAVNEHGFIRIDEQLRSTSHANVWAAGDCAAWATPLPKAGVFAVRMAPVLAHNLRVATGAGGAARRYEPQRRFLSLLSTADGRAIASWGPLGAEGRFAWRWKDRIDRRFVRRYAIGP